MSIAKVERRHVLGAAVTPQNGVGFKDDQNVIYSIGKTIVIHNIDQKKQVFLPNPERGKVICAMAVSPKRQYVAVAESGGRVFFSIYDLSVNKRRKVFSYYDFGSTDCRCLAFSSDDKHLLCQGGSPDWTLLLYLWEKGKLITYVKLSVPSPSKNLINQVLFCPTDNNFVSVVGDGFLKLFRLNEGLLRGFGFQKSENICCLCQAWVGEFLFIGTSHSSILIVENGELKGKIMVHTSFDADIGSDKDFSGSSEKIATFSNASVASSVEIQSGAITAITSYSKGFICAAGLGSVYIYEKPEDTSASHRCYWELVRDYKLVKIPPDPYLTNPSSTEKQRITHLALSPNEETIVAVTEISQFYYIQSASTELRSTNAFEFEHLFHPWHTGGINDFDVCFRKPLVVTCGTDRQLCLWNYETSKMELHKEFQEDIHSVSLHPTGNFMVASFQSKIKYMNVLIDDFRVFKEFSVHNSRHCVFSHGGHAFSAVNGNLIQIYSSITFDIIHNLRGHNDKIQKLVWSNNDCELISCGFDGAVYVWSAVNGARLQELVLRTCGFKSVTISPDASKQFASGTDKTVKEIFDSTVQYDIDCKEVLMTTLVLSYSGKMLFGGTENGTLRVFKFPLSLSTDWHEINCHTGPITAMKMTCDDTRLITVSEDGLLIVWNAWERDKPVRREKELQYLEEVLITKTDLEEKLEALEEYRNQLNQMTLEHQYQMRMKDMAFNEKIKDLSDKFLLQMEELKAKNDDLHNQIEIENSGHREDVRSLKNYHEEIVQELEAKNNAKLIMEFEKYEQLNCRIQQMKDDYETQICQLKDEYSQETKETTVFFEGQLQEKVRTLVKAKEQANLQSREFEEMKKQMEEDVDLELLEIRVKYEGKLKEEKENNVRLRGEVGMLKKKFGSIHSELETKEKDLQRMNNEQQRLTAIIRSLEKDIQELRKEILERDETIEDKEKRICELKKKNQELDKFKFVLDYKIKELNRQLDPKEKEIKELTEQIIEMERELSRLQKANIKFEVSGNDMKEKLDGIQADLKLERTRNYDLRHKLNEMRCELSEAAALIQNPKKLKERVKKMFERHAKNRTKPKAVDEDVKREFERHHEFLESVVSKLQKKIEEHALRGQPNAKLIKENSELLEQINKMKQDLDIASAHVKEMEGSLGISFRILMLEDGKEKMTALLSAHRGLEMQHKQEIEVRS